MIRRCLKPLVLVRWGIHKPHATRPTLNHEPEHSKVCVLRDVRVPCLVRYLAEPHGIDAAIPVSFVVSRVDLEFLVPKFQELRQSHVRPGKVTLLQPFIQVLCPSDSLRDLPGRDQGREPDALAVFLSATWIPGPVTGVGAASSSPSGCSSGIAAMQS